MTTRRRRFATFALVLIAGIAGNLAFGSAAYAADPVSVGGTVWVDSNRNGVRDAGEPPHVTPYILFSFFNATTGADVGGGLYNNTSGNWVRAGLDPDTEYKVCITEIPPGMELTASFQGSDTAKDSDFGTDLCATFTTPTSGANSSTTPDLAGIDLGLTPLPDPYIAKYQRVDGGSGLPTASSVVTPAVAAPLYRYAAFRTGTRVQYLIEVGNKAQGEDNTGLEFSDAAPDELDDVDVLGILDGTYAESTCADTNVSGNVVSGTITEALSGAGAKCYIVVEGTLTETPAAGVDNVATLTVPDGVENTLTSNDSSGQTTATYTPKQPSCAAGELFGIQARQNVIFQVDADTGTMNPVGMFPTKNTLNGLGIAPTGKYWAFTQGVLDGSTTAKFYSFDPVTGETAVYPSTIPTSETSTMIAGSVRKDGIMFALGTNVPSDTVDRQLNLYAFDTNTGTYIGKVATLTLTFAEGATRFGTGANGDIAFDNDGNLYYTTETDATGYNGMVARWDAPLPSTAGSPTIEGKIVSLLNTSTLNNGIAFSADGVLYVNGFEGTANDSSEVVSTIDPESGEQIDQVALPYTYPQAARTLNDLASCGFPGTIELKKVVEGRTLPTDDFSLSIASGGTSLASGATGVADGAGSSEATTGSMLASAGAEYTLAEAGVDATDLAAYTSTYSCIDREAGNAVISSGSATEFTLRYPEASGSHSVVCTFTNTPKAAALELDKSSDPASAQDLRPGATVTYTVTATNTGAVDLSSATVDDDLSDVLDSAKLVDGSPAASIDGADAGEPRVTDARLSWTGELPAGETVTITYQVTVNSDAATGDDLANVVFASDVVSATGAEVAVNCTEASAASTPGCATLHRVSLQAAVAPGAAASAGSQGGLASTGLAIGAGVAAALGLLAAGAAGLVMHRRRSS